ncbi:MAG: hypothetical protein HJJLKODD_02796 [Phycisphaerae bacterium]|nr:hypothetical protein [Phycisphaerae bacterium]
MFKLDGIEKNFKFMTWEVTKQVELTYRIMDQPSRGLIRKILSSDNYIDTMKSLIEKKCLSYYRNHPTIDKQTADTIRAVTVVATNLEKIADYCSNIANSMQKMDDSAFMARFEYQPYFEQILRALEVVPPAFDERDSAKAIKICQYETHLNKLYEADYERVRLAMRLGRDTDNLLIALRILHYLERMGDALLNIGEAILFALSGEKMKYHQYVSLDEAMHTANPQTENYSVDFKWETRSGARIGKVADHSAESNGGEAIYKEGAADKLRRERDSIQQWNTFWPGLPPKVLEYREGNGDASLLLEFLDGFTFQEMILNADPDMLLSAQNCIHQVLQKIWTTTLENQSISTNYIGQLQERIDDVFRVHPNYRRTRQRLGRLEIESFEELLIRAGELETQLPAPFSVFIHGDFNIDNIIYNPRHERVHFIDLYRSKRWDYVQDVSVFLISNYRIPIFEPRLRQRLNVIMQTFLEFTRSVARQLPDHTFDARLALGLIRSLVTSTRFELDSWFSGQMYHRAIYLLHKLIDHHDRPWSEFRIVDDVLIF